MLHPSNVSLSIGLYTRAILLVASPNSQPCSQPANRGTRRPLHVVAILLVRAVHSHQRGSCCLGNVLLAYHHVHIPILLSLGSHQVCHKEAHPEAKNETMVNLNKLRRWLI